MNPSLTVACVPLDALREIKNTRAESAAAVRMVGPTPASDVTHVPDDRDWSGVRGDGLALLVDTDGQHRHPTVPPALPCGHAVSAPPVRRLGRRRAPGTVARASATRQTPAMTQHPHVCVPSAHTQGTSISTGGTTQRSSTLLLHHRGSHHPHPQALEKGMSPQRMGRLWKAAVVAPPSPLQLVGTERQVQSAGVRGFCYRV